MVKVLVEPEDGNGMGKKRKRKTKIAENKGGHNTGVYVLILV